MAKFKKGQSGNPNGRPRGVRNKNTPAGMVERALKNGYDLVDIKRLIMDLVSNPDTKMSAAQIERLIKTAVDLEVKLIELEHKYAGNEDSKPSQDDDYDGEEVVFKTTVD